MNAHYRHLNQKKSREIKIVKLLLEFVEDTKKQNRKQKKGDTFYQVFLYCGFSLCFPMFSMIIDLSTVCV